MEYKVGDSPTTEREVLLQSYLSRDFLTGNVIRH